MANSLDDNIFWKTRLENQQAIQKQQMDFFRKKSKKYKRGVTNEKKVEKHL